MLHLWSDPELKFLSNFYSHPVEIDGLIWPTTEHYYQAHKSSCPVIRESIRLLSSPGKAKRAGQKLPLEPSWTHKKFMVMMKALLVKFKDPELQSKLLSLKGTIVEDNKDEIWGSGIPQGEGPGMNMLGKLLMMTRDHYAGKLISPLENPLPMESSPGDFASKRKFDVHTGIDIYCEDGSEVKSMNQGKVVLIEHFTGDQAQSPWWENTEAVIIEHPQGFVLYGEITPKVKVGDVVCAGDVIGNVKKVLKKDKGLPQSMLHLEYYAQFPDKGGVVWLLEDSFPKNLLNPRLWFPQNLFKGGG